MGEFKKQKFESHVSELSSQMPRLRERLVDCTKQLLMKHMTRNILKKTQSGDQPDGVARKQKYYEFKRGSTPLEGRNHDRLDKPAPVLLSLQFPGVV